MNRRLAVVIAGLSLTGLVAPGYAAEAASKPKPAPKPVCLLVTDPTGDAKFQGQGSNYPADDIISGDIATGKKTIVGVLRLVSGDTSTGFPTGVTYELSWTQKQKGSNGATSTTQAAFFFYVYATGGTSAGFGSSSDPNAPPSDQSTNTGPTPMPFPQATMDGHGIITWVMKRTDASVVSGAKFSALKATTSAGLNVQDGNGGTRSSYQPPLDAASGHGSYTDMQASCVRAS